MNVLLISQCDKRALTETRRILDQFAERRGDRTWQTPITQDGLDTLRRLLRKTARKNTAVACHWILGLDHSELLWVVGDARRFNAHGAVPTNTTTRDVLRRSSENDWRHGEVIHLLTALAALVHDLGKASLAFQWRLQGKLAERNQYRHEWVSLRLFEAFVGQDDDARWLERLAQRSETEAAWLKLLRVDGPGSAPPPPFIGLGHAPLAQAIGWLVVTHHRLPVFHGQSADERPAPGHFQAPLRHLTSAWNEPPSSNDPAVVDPYWQFPQGLPVTHEAWRERAARIARRLLALQAQPGAGGWLANPYVMHVSRLALMLADHHYSSLEGAHPERIKLTAPGPLYANTTRDGNMNQTLDEHLVGVARLGAELAHFLPRFERHLPRLGRHRALARRSQDERFRWQDRAAELAAGLRERSARQGAFIVNMASTGCGKTLANARVMYALADPEQGMRCAFAMGLRSLTLQTGRAFRDLLSLGDDELAIRVGGTASRALFDYHERQAEATGSASRQSLLDEDAHVVYDGQHDQHPLLRRAFADPNVRRLLAAPLLVCTIDHLTPATEGLRGGRQIAPMLRLMSGDLVLDEPDDFDIADLPALTRLVHWAGLLGSRVLLSSATLPPALVQGLFEAYRSGRVHYQSSRGEPLPPGAAPPAVCCAWVDEYARDQADCPTPAAFAEAHERFARQRAARLMQAEPRRLAEIVPLADLPRDRDAQAEPFASRVLASAAALHAAHHDIDPVSGKRVSFGLVRMANIEPLVAVALALFRLGAPAGLRIHLCVYHSQFPLLLRSGIEQRLDRALNRRDPAAVFALPDVRQPLDAHPEPDHLFIVLGSPVTEVGRDHDYDWAVVEPSSMRSLIQLAGRVRRHRPGLCSLPNLHVFSSNLRHFRAPSEPAFCRPGFETGGLLLASHDLRNLLSPDESRHIDARARILARPADQLRPRERWVDLEHARMRATMLPAAAVQATPPASNRRRGATTPAPLLINAATWWHLPPQDALLTGLLQQATPFRADGRPQADLVLLPNDDGDDYALHRVVDPRAGWRTRASYTVVDASQNHRIPDEALSGCGISTWGQTDYLATLADLAQDLDMPLDTCAKRFGTVTLPEHDDGWAFHPTLGFTKGRRP